MGRRTHTIQHRHTCGKTMGDNGGLGKADAPSSTGTHMWRDTGRQWETRGEKTSGRQTHHPTNGNKKGDHGRQGETRPWKRGHTILAMGNKTGRARFAPGIFSPLPGDFFPLQERINSPAIYSMLNLEAAISTIFAAFWNYFYGSCRILQQETDGKSSIVELETFFAGIVFFFGASSNLGLVQLEVLGLLW